MAGKVLIESLKNIPEEILLDGQVSRKVFITDKIEVVKYTYNEGAVFPEHSHPEEQVTIVVRGEITFEIDGESRTLVTGDICYVPSDKPHLARVGQSGKVSTLNIFSPSRKKRP